ncbi:MAG: hypothetical protein GXP25_11480 [Planctomycetes bacterium]|nr:hypothetical protein [Planctomycetota bacterium]
MLNKKGNVCAFLALGAVLLFYAVNRTPQNQEALPLISSVQADEDQSSTDGKGKGLAALERAAKQGRYLFVFFFKEEDDQTSRMRGVFDAAVKKAGEKADGIAVKITDPSEKGIVDRFRVDRAPMPLSLAVAPNGVVTGGFPVRFTEKQLAGAMVGPAFQKCLKALRERKLVFVCVQGKSTKSNDEAMKGVQDFKADSRYSLATEVVPLDPADSAEAKFLRKLKIDPKISEAITVFLAPPGASIGRFTGATDKDTLVKTLTSAMAACGSGSGCGTGTGCGPAPKSGG